MTKTRQRGERKWWACRPRCSGFSMIELLAVMAVMGLLATFVAPSIQSMVCGTQLTQGAQILTDNLALARQAALARNHTVEVRLFQYGDPGVPGEKADDPDSGKYRALQIIDVSAGDVPLTKVIRLPDSIEIDASSTYSSLISSASAGDSAPRMSTGAAETTAIPRAGTNYNFIAFKFKPGGSTNLAAASSWFLTLRNIQNEDGPLENFVTIQIDPINGHVRSFRP